MLRRSIINLQSLAHDAAFRQKLIVTSNNQGATWKHAIIWECISFSFILSILTLCSGCNSLDKACT